MNTLIEILRRVRFLWALLAIGLTLYLLTGSPARWWMIMPAVALLWVPWYMKWQIRWCLALMWAGACATLFVLRPSGGTLEFAVYVGPIGAAAIVALGFLVAPIFKR